MNIVFDRARAIARGPHRPVLLVLLMLGSASAAAALSQNDIVSPGGFVTSLSGLTGGANPDPGFDPAGAFIPSGVQINQQVFSGNGSASTSSSYDNTVSFNSSGGSAALGQVSFFGHAQSAYDQTTGGHSNSWVHGGWMDRLTINAPGLTGTQAIWLFEVDIFGAFDVSGRIASTRIEVEPYVDHSRLHRSTPGFDPSGSDPLSTTIQHTEWGLFVPFPNAVIQTSATDTVTFAAPITIGTAFDLGIYALGIVSASSTSAFPNAISTAGLGPGSVRWGGSAGLTTLGGAPINSFALSSLSGTDWVQPIPLPAALAMMPSALALLFAVRPAAVRRRSRGSRRPGRL